MTPIGMSGPIISLIEKGFVDFIISTGANLYHDMHRPFDCPMFQGHFMVDDNALAEQDIARIYDTFIEDSATLQATDTIIHQAMWNLPTDKPISTAQLHKHLGEAISKHAPAAGKSLLAAASKYEVPIYVSAPGDSSIAMNLVVEHLFNKPIVLDPVRDVIETAAIVRAAERNGAVEIGGGSPKNFYLQTQPTLAQILRDHSKGGHDYFIQLTTDSPQWGGLSGATPQEAKSWGKIKDAHINNVVVYSCASITFPILCQYALATNKPRQHKRLYGRLEKLVEELTKAAKSNPELLKDVEKIKKHVSHGDQ
jgi:deoxyhypusine synthase